MKNLKLFLKCLLPIIAYIILYNLLKSIEIVFLVFQILILFISSKMQKKDIVFINISFFLFFILPIFFEDAFISLTLVFTTFFLISTVIGFTYFKRKLIIILYSLLLIITSHYGFKNLWSYEINFNSRTKNFNVDLKLKDGDDFIINLDSIQKNIIVLDLWTTSCSKCFEGFPMLDKIYKKYELNNKVSIYAVNIPLNSDKPNQAKKMISKKDYSFPVLYANNKEFVERLGIKKYPHVLILKNGKIKFSGYPIFDDEILFYNLENEIKSQLK